MQSSLMSATMSGALPLRWGVAQPACWVPPGAAGLGTAWDEYAFRRFGFRVV